MTKRIRKDTRTHLVTELQDFLRDSPDMIAYRKGLIRNIIKEAIAGEFHDYKNQKYTCGKVALVAYLQEAGLMQLSQRVIDGEFDEEADEEDKAEMRKDLQRSMSPKGELESMWPIMGLDVIQ